MKDKLIKSLVGLVSIAICYILTIAVLSVSPVTVGVSSAATIGGPTLGPAPSSSGSATGISLTAFNQNQFGSNNLGINIKSGATETNKIFYSGVDLRTGVYSGDASGETNIQGTAFSSGAATASGTNVALTIGNIYQTITLAAACNFTTISGIGVVSVKVLAGGANRIISFPTNWCWLNTNGFALSGSLYSITLTNKASSVGWLSLHNSGTDVTNVSAAYQQSP